MEKRLNSGAEKDMLNTKRQPTVRLQTKCSLHKEAGTQPPKSAAPGEGDLLSTTLPLPRESWHPALLHVHRHRAGDSNSRGAGCRTPGLDPKNDKTTYTIYGCFQGSGNRPSDSTYTEKK